mgnify:CR=1 FL=1
MRLERVREPPQRRDDELDLLVGRGRAQLESFDAIVERSFAAVRRLEESLFGLVRERVARVAAQVACQRQPFESIVMGSVGPNHLCPSCGKVGRGGYAVDGLFFGPICTNGPHNCLDRRRPYSVDQDIRLASSTLSKSCFLDTYNHM